MVHNWKAKDSDTVMKRVGRATAGGIPVLSRYMRFTDGLTVRAFELCRNVIAMPPSSANWSKNFGYFPGRPKCIQYFATL
jgi:hypothetical protein